MPNSSIASSESSADRRPSPRADTYLLIVLIGLAAVLILAEIAIRRELVGGVRSRESRVHAVLSSTMSDVILGDSHAFRAFATRKDFLNLARDKTTPQSMEILAREYFRRREPGRVILGAPRHLFSALHEREGAQQHDEFFAQHALGLPFTIYLLEPGISRALFKLWDLRALRVEIGGSLARLIPGSPSERLLVGNWLALAPEEKRKRARIRAMRHRPLEDIEASESYASYRRMIELLLEKGARLCMVEPPVHPTYEEATRKPIFENAREVNRALARQYGIPFADAEGLPRRLGARDFYDQDHLTAGAASVFARHALTRCFGERPLGG